jgi:signal transduction histidine kinase
MFNKLRKNIAIRNSVTLGTAYIAILMLILLTNLFQLNSDVSTRLAEISEVKYFDIQGEVDVEYNEYSKSSICIILTTSGLYMVSNNDFYDEDTLNTFIENIPQWANSDKINRCIINDNYMAYNIVEDKFSQYYTAYIYDYTSESKTLLELAVTIAIIGIFGMIGIVAFSFRAADKSVEPIENVFNKQKELVGNASHELKTPITIIGTNLSILYDNIENIPEEERKWIKGIDTQVKRLNNLVVEMLELAKMDASQSVPMTSHISLSDIAQRVELEAEVLAYENNINMVADINNNIKIMGVEANIEKLIYILIDNAIKYTNKTGTVTLSIGVEKKHPFIKVKNTGEGINKEDIDKLFDRFYRVNKAHSTSEVTTKSFGLGLAIAKSIVDGHNAEITVDSKVGEFTEFCVTFPTH